MKFSVNTRDIRAVRERLRTVGDTLRREQPRVLEALGVRLLSFSKQDYVKKSRGGMGSDGIKWEPLAESTIKQKNRRGKRNAKRKTTKSGKARPGMKSSAIGINTGLQLNSATPGFTAAGGGNILALTETTVTVGYGRSYSRYFDKRRQLLPAKLPETWRKACIAIVNRWVQAVLKGAVRG